MTAQEIVENARKAKPHVRYAAHKDGGAVAGWAESLGRFVIVASRAITGEWVSMPYELLINGSPCHTPADWIE
jgi:hypothetical protein